MIKNRLYDIVVLPYQAQFAKHQALEGINGLFEMLLKHGHCPSVRVLHKNKSFDLSAWDVLSRVSLIEHSSNVARIAIEIVRKTSSCDKEINMAMVIAAALAHDIGKLPIFGDPYTFASHPLSSSRFVCQCFFDAHRHWTENVAQIVVNHHRPTENKLCKILQKADRQSREQELLRG